MLILAIAFAVVSACMLMYLLYSLAPDFDSRIDIVQSETPKDSDVIPAVSIAPKTKSVKSNRKADFSRAYTRDDNNDVSASLIFRPPIMEAGSVTQYIPKSDWDAWSSIGSGAAESSSSGGSHSSSSNDIPSSSSSGSDYSSSSSSSDSSSSSSSYDSSSSSSGGDW